MFDKLFASLRRSEYPILFGFFKLNLTVTLLFTMNVRVLDGEASTDMLFAKLLDDGGVARNLDCDN